MSDHPDPAPPLAPQVGSLHCQHCRYELRPVHLDRHGDTYIIINGERRVRTRVLCHICGTFTEFRSVYAPELRAKGKSMTENREHWLNGWARTKDHVLIGTLIHCSGCGRISGMASVVFVEGQTEPEKHPDWKFNEVDCPVCKNWRNDLKEQPTNPPLSEIPLSEIRDEIARRKAAN